jgi:FixJ family two-component response regulator
VVEDDADERTALGRVLCASGFAVKSYESAEEYLGTTATEPVCLLVDLQLGGLSGLDLLRELRISGSTLPVIIITATDDAGIRSEAEQLGCTAYLRKPFQGRALVEILRGVALQRRSTADLSK